jgi:hypothetical protein
MQNPDVFNLSDERITALLDRWCYECSARFVRILDASAPLVATRTVPDVQRMLLGYCKLPCCSRHVFAVMQRGKPSIVAAFEKLGTALVFKACVTDHARITQAHYPFSSLIDYDVHMLCVEPPGPRRDELMDPTGVNTGYACSTTYCYGTVMEQYIAWCNTPSPWWSNARYACTYETPFVDAITRSVQNEKAMQRHRALMYSGVGPSREYLRSARIGVTRLTSPVVTMVTTLEDTYMRDHHTIVAAPNKPSPRLLLMPPPPPPPSSSSPLPATTTTTPTRQRCVETINVETTPQQKHIFVVLDVNNDIVFAAFMKFSRALAFYNELLSHTAAHSKTLPRFEYAWKQRFHIFIHSLNPSPPVASSLPQGVHFSCDFVRSSLHRDADLDAYYAWLAQGNTLPATVYSAPAYVEDIDVDVLSDTASDLLLHRLHTASRVIMSLGAPSPSRTYTTASIDLNYWHTLQNE